MNYFISYTYYFEGKRLGNIVVALPYEITVRNLRNVEDMVEEEVKKELGIDGDIHLVILNFIRID